MARRSQRCAVCPDRTGLVGILVGGEQMYLCAHHAELVGERIHECFDDMAALCARTSLERRGRPDRREGERRIFPRPELRRHDQGRRATDPDY